MDVRLTVELCNWIDCKRRLIQYHPNDVKNRRPGLMSNARRNIKHLRRRLRYDV